MLTNNDIDILYNEMPLKVLWAMVGGRIHANDTNKNLPSLLFTFSPALTIFYSLFSIIYNS